MTQIHLWLEQTPLIASYATTTSMEQHLILLTFKGLSCLREVSWVLCYYQANGIIMSCMFVIYFHSVFSEISKDSVFESVNSTYQIIKARIMWHYAQAHCHSIDSHLAAFETAEEFSSISAYLPDERLHFGLNDLKQNKKFVWEHSGQAVGAYRNWAPQKPSHRSGENCGFFDREGWYDARCSNYNQNFICEFPKQ